MAGFITFITQNYPDIVRLIVEHLQLTLMAVLVSIAIGVPLGILISYISRLTKPVLGLANIVQAVPSLALLGFLIPFMGIGSKPAIFMVVVYSLLPIIKNTATGLNNISPEMIEAANGIGMTPFQVLYKIKLPQALPVIMAGVRISAVTAVGLVTIAAFIGAGGLGYLVYAGIRTVNNYQILAGAIPACVIALGIDALAGMVERSVTPISFRSDVQSFTPQKIQAHMTFRKVVLIGTAIFIAAIFILSSFSNVAPKGKTIRIGSKDFTEQEIIAHIYADMIEDRTDIEVDRQTALGGTQVVFGAMRNGSLNMYIEYTGTIYGNILQQTEQLPADELFQYVADAMQKDYGFALVAPAGFNNTYTLAMDANVAEERGIKTISELAIQSPQLKMASTIEFMNRADGLPSLTEAYGLKFKEVLSIDSSPRYTAMQAGQVQVVDAFNTDGILEKFNCIVLEDDKEFFPGYYAVPMLRQEVLDEYPELITVLQELENKLDDSQMRQLNYQVDVLEKTPREVARNFLAEQG